MSERSAVGRAPGLREVLAVAALVVAAVLALEALSTFVPVIHDAFRGLPVTVAVLVAGTIVVLAMVLRRPSRGR